LFFPEKLIKTMERSRFVFHRQTMALSDRNEPIILFVKLDENNNNK
jgi:hypothetical protein